MEQKAFDLIAEKVGAVLDGQGFVRTGEVQQDGEGRSVLFKGENTAYSILYNQGKKRFELRTCDAEDGEPDLKWKSISIWLFDPETDSLSEADSIVNDFVETIEGPKRLAAAKTKKKRKKDDENNADPLFFFNRFVGIFPELKDELNYEKSQYDEVRAVHFAKESLVPKVDMLCSQSGRTDSIKRCCDLLNDMYANGDMDVRSIITIVVLNGLSSQSVENMKPMFTDDLKKGFTAGLKFKGKVVKPAKKKKEKRFVAANLNDMK
ncbi:DUF7674 family protein [Caproiciproducens faecalis]|uniref:DUF7674 domain-containing protein n=1 Tax=Caproiciproducens faecalis TaxID=2820301 RepID=A0ABS7DKJ9_9FIRM|nr:hypothetical protein [Caproiciproducens faecalis]MBW7571607.1 hypothetical protein [Caproiciproducens faecalis]